MAHSHPRVWELPEAQMPCAPVTGYVDGLYPNTRGSPFRVQRTHRKKRTKEECDLTELYADLSTFMV